MFSLTSLRVFAVAFTAWAGLSTASAGAVLPNRFQVQAFNSGGGFVHATASHGFITGNTKGGNTTPLTTLLNSGTSGQGDSAELRFPRNDKNLNQGSLPIEISASGMFSTAASFGDLDTAGQLVDLVDGTAVLPEQGQWQFLGDSDSASGANPFTSVSTGSTGDLDLNLADWETGTLSGDFVLALKAGNQYAVYAFQGLRDVTRFSYDFGAGDSEFHLGLSHAALYYGGTAAADFGSGDSLSGGAPILNPEPSSLAIFALAGVGMGGLVIRRRRQIH